MRTSGNCSITIRACVRGLDFPFLAAPKCALNLFHAGKLIVVPSRASNRNCFQRTSFPCRSWNRFPVASIVQNFQRALQYAGKVRRDVDGARDAQPRHLHQRQGTSAKSDTRPSGGLDKYVVRQQSAESTQVVLTNLVPYLMPQFIREHSANPP